MTRVVAVVTAFGPDRRLADLVASAAAQCAAVVVVDDGSTEGTEILADLPGARVVRQDNAGVAAALNTGVRVALYEMAADAVLTLDQDTSLPPGYATAAVATWQRATGAGIPVALVAPATYSGRPAPTRGTSGGFALAFDPMTSGSLVPAATYRAVGGYDESLVIDAVDSELTARCLCAGLLPVIAPQCHLGHGMGEPVAASRRRRPYHRHSPARVYYMARNGVLVARRYARAQPAWVARRLLEEAKGHALRLALSPDRLALARAAATGVRDGLAGRTGRTGPALSPR